MRSSKDYQSTRKLLLLIGSVLFSCLLMALSMVTSPAQAATILSVAHEDKLLVAEVDLLDGESHFSMVQGVAADRETTFSLFGDSFGKANEWAESFHRVIPTIPGFPYRIIDQNPDRLKLDLPHVLSTFITLQSYSGMPALQNTPPITPVSPLSSSAFLFVPALVGIFGVVFRAGSSLKTLNHGNESQPNQFPEARSILILVLSPDVTFAKEIEGQLRRAGYPGRVVSSVNDVLMIASHTPLSLVLVDHRVADWDVLRTDSTLRHVPMIALVPPGSFYTEENCLADFNRGMDGTHDTRDGHRLLVAKVGAYLRRAGYDVLRRAVYRIGAVELDSDIREVKVGGQRIQLSTKPFVLLEAFMQAPSKVFRRDELVDLVWGPNFAIGDHTLDVHVYTLRKLLQHDPDRVCRLITIKGVGFKLKSFSPVMPATSVPATLPMETHSLPLRDSNEVHASKTHRIIALSPSTIRRPRPGQVLRQRRSRLCRKTKSVRPLHSTVSVA